MSRPADIMIALLGAGRASRFGADKLSQSCAGKPLGQWALEAAQAMELPLVWIAGDAAPDFVTCEVVRNSRASEGMSTSVICAARAARRRGARRVLFMLADMPLVTSDLLRRLIEAGEAAGCRYPEGYAGVPALIPVRALENRVRLERDQGAGAILRSIDGLALLDCSDSELFDVDTPQALAHAECLLRERTAA
ncbi:nucleotidyltransferase family protein [Novosphingobium aquae]|uniref:NTP transferase domain-containing protein n=1 Tax=Novosphingobium aquae TaxID=3133435 RepID=A0ABU8SA76_9SPHN